MREDDFFWYQTYGSSKIRQDFINILMSDFIWEIYIIIIFSF